MRFFDALSKHQGAASDDAGGDIEGDGTIDGLRPKFVPFYLSDALIDGVKERLLDITTVADRLGTSVRHVRRLVFERRIPHIKCGGLVRFDPAAVDDWLDKMRRDPEPRPRRTATRPPK